jgi:hypothetical protein
MIYYYYYQLGIGFANLIIVFLGNVYYEVILAWTLRYLFDSFSTDLPWRHCTNKWNTECCSEQLLYGSSSSSSSPTTTTSNNNDNQKLLSPSTSSSSNKSALITSLLTTTSTKSLLSQFNSDNMTNLSKHHGCEKIHDPITEYWE